MAVEGYNQPSKITVKNTRIENLGLIYVNYYQAPEANRVFKAESCYVRNRIQMFYCGDSCYARSCSLDAENYEGATISNSEYGVPRYENCIIQGESSRCARLMTAGKAQFVGCTFIGDELAASGNYIYLEGSTSKLFVNDCYIGADATKNRGVYDYSSNTYMKIRNTVFDDYVYGIMSNDTVDAGTLADPGHNCFLDDDAYAIYNSGILTHYGQWNYYDTLLFNGTVVRDSVDVYCHVDSTLARRLTDKLTQVTPKKFSLGNAYPNPFNTSVELTFEVPELAKVRLEILDVVGKRIATVCDGEYTPGEYHVFWIPEQKVPSGSYFYRLLANDFSETKKMQLVK